MAALPLTAVTETDNQYIRIDISYVYFDHTAWNDVDSGCSTTTNIVMHQYLHKHAAPSFCHFYITLTHHTPTHHSHSYLLLSGMKLFVLAPDPALSLGGNIRK